MAIYLTNDAFMQSDWQKSRKLHRSSAMYLEHAVARWLSKGGPIISIPATMVLWSMVRWEHGGAFFLLESHFSVMASKIENLVGDMIEKSRSEMYSRQLSKAHARRMSFEG